MTKLSFLKYLATSHFGKLAFAVDNDKLQKIDKKDPSLIIHGEAIVITQGRSHWIREINVFFHYLE